ncbi:MAG: glycosyltransferase family 39 protein, partial [Deltaproteobacteria bacterium]|nr:glycosyltransferase family 39 protein [Deltaproteobacteria bacterium]
MIGPRTVGWILALLTTVLVVANQQEVGIARDEVVYMQTGERYAKWWRAGLLGADTASNDKITKTWGGPSPTDNNREHPPLIKTLSGFSKLFLHDTLGVDEVTAYRFPAAVLHGLLVLLVFLMVLELFGFAEAVMSGLLVMFLPRALFHAGLACFDAPIMTLWFAVVFAYWKSLDGRKWPWLVGIVFGLALATKHNALLLPIALGLHYLVAGVRDRGARFITYRWRVIVSMLVLAPLTFIALWPWLWFDTYDHVRDWLMFHLKHVHYNFEYLGANWNAPRFPWHVALVTTLVTVPVVTLAGAVVGAGVWIARRARSTADARAPALLLALSAAASIGPFFLG